MEQPEIDYVLDAGSPDKNEDYIWIGNEEGYNTVLILDGTSGTEGDFGGEEDETGGQKYVRYFGEELEKIIKKEPEKDLKELMKSVISQVWDRFESEAEENIERYFEGQETDLQRAETVPAAVGAVVRWDDEVLELMHVGDVETYIVAEDSKDIFSNNIHEKFDDLRDEYVEKYGRDSEEVREITSKHRSAHNLPGTYPNMSFNPLSVEKLGIKKNYSIENVDRVVLSTDGGTVRMKRLLGLDEKEVLNFLAEKGPERAVKTLREKEQQKNVKALKNSDDAAIVDIRFNK
jgi:hypothetical protein